MQAFDEESRARIAKHRKARSGKGFETIEQGTHLETVCLPGGCTALLECMSNLVANEVFAPEGRGADCSEVLKCGLHHLAGTAAHLVIVTNDIFSDGVTYDPETEQYRKILGEVNREAAAMADYVYEEVRKETLRTKMTKITDGQIHKGVLADEGSGEYCCGIFHVFENTDATH